MQEARALPQGQAGPPTPVREQGEQLPLQVGAAEQGQVRVSSPPRAQLVRLWAQAIPLAQVAHSAAGQRVVAMAAVSTPV